MNHVQSVYISDIPPAVEEVYGDTPRGPQLLAMIYILHIQASILKAGFVFVHKSSVCNAM